MTVRPNQTVDPVTLEIVRNLLIAILDEGEINLSRTAFSPIIYEVKDYCVGLLDREGRTIAQSRGGIPTFMADLGEPVRDGIEIYGHDGIDPGDVLITNYSAVCGQHLNNVVLYVPVHVDGELVAFAATRAHWTDMGGRVSGSFSTDTTEIFQEGLQVRSVKVHKRGKPDEEILRIIRHNIRYPELSFGDMAAQVAACELTARRFGDLARKYGWPTIQACIYRIWDQSEAMVRQQIAALPRGRFEAESFLDDDGIDPDHTLPIKVAVTVRDDELEIDFTGTAEQTRGPMNSGRSGGMAAARVAFKSAVAPNLPPNDGAFRPLKVVLPEGTLISAVDNAAMAHWNLALKTVIDTIYLALSQVMPNRVPAAHHAAQGLYTFFGRDAAGYRFSTLDTTLGGWGARPDADGFSPLKTTTHGDTRNIPIEVEETFYPLQVERYEWRPDSGGAGEFRGGLGLSKVYRTTQDCSLVTAFERTKCPPWGLFGGKAGEIAGAYVQQPGETDVHGYRKVTALPLRAGAKVEFLSAGGGGRGHPIKRLISRVLEDVRQGYVSVEGARRDYGVVVDPATLMVDESATAALRKQLHSEALEAAE
jgi:N-methylhydantoinase B